MKIVVKILFILVLSVADIFLFRAGILGVEPSLIILPVLFALTFVNINYSKYVSFSKNNTSIFFISLVLLGILYLPISKYVDSEKSAGLYVLSLLVYLSAFVFFSAIKINEIKSIFISAFLILSFSILFDMFFGEGIRGAGFAENPNGAALRINFILLIILGCLDNIRNKILFLIAGFIIVFLTLSRSGIVIYFMIFVLSLLNGFNLRMSLRAMKKRFFKVIFIFIVIVISFFSIVNFIVSFIPAFKHRAAVERIEKISGQKDLISDVDLGEGGRIAIATDYLSFLVQNPFGYGTGVSSDRNFYEAATHNLFLRVSIDFGFFGFFILTVFLFRGTKIGFKEGNLFYSLFFLTIILSCFFTNTLIENRTFIIALAAFDVLRKKI